jgi:hypothetical protein
VASFDKQDGVTYDYQWSVSPNGNYFLMDGDGKSTDESPGGIITSKFEKVFVGSLTNSEGTPTITCKVVKHGGDTVGTGTTSVQFVKDVTIYKGKMTFDGAIISGGQGTIAYAFADVQQKPNVEHYVAQVRDEQGHLVKTVNWGPEPYHAFLPIEQLRLGSDWSRITIDSINSANGSPEEAPNLLAGSLTTLRLRHQKNTVVVTGYYPKP